MSDNETLADIVADIRAQNQGLPEDGYALSPLVCDLLRLADRIEAAERRGRCGSKAITGFLKSHCRVCQCEKTGEGYGDVPPKIGYDDICDECEVAKELRFRLGLTGEEAAK